VSCRPFAPGARALAAPLLLLALAAPTRSAAVTFEEANQHYLAKDWAKTVASFTELVRAEPQNARAWYRLGMGHHGLKDFTQAIAAFRKAEAIGHNPVVMVQLAGAYVAAGGAGGTDSCFAWLNRAADAGYQQPDGVTGSAELASVRGDRRYDAVVERLRRAATPCAFSPEARQFDFWLGSWDVRTPQGDLAGTNDIRSGAGECVMVENWKSTQGGTGQSLNFYDVDAKLWRQIWVDAGAEVTRFEGAFIDGAMRFKGERVSKTGQRIPVKMTFTPLPDGRVRQMGEASSDGGKTWSVEYDLYYNPARRDG
jgi:hypothetical protein